MYSQQLATRELDVFSTASFTGTGCILWVNQLGIPSFHVQDKLKKSRQLAVVFSFRVKKEEKKHDIEYRGPSFPPCQGRGEITYRMSGHRPLVDVPCQK
eukprot:g71670.t1